VLLQLTEARSVNFSPSAVMNPCGSPNAFFAAPVRKKAGDANKLKAVDGRLTLTASKSPWSTESDPAAPPAPDDFFWDWDRPEDVPGRDCGLFEMDGRGEEGALVAAGERNQG
jgi:hypothetical protein